MFENYARPRHGADFLPATFCIPREIMSLWNYGDVIFNLGHPRRGPCGSLCFVSLDPGTHTTVELHSRAINLDRNSPGIQFGVSFERLLNPGLDICGRHLRLDLYIICDAEHSSQTLDSR